MRLSGIIGIDVQLVILPSRVVTDTSYTYLQSCLQSFACDIKEFPLQCVHMGGDYRHDSFSNSLISQGSVTNMYYDGIDNVVYGTCHIQERELIHQMILCQQEYGVESLQTQYEVSINAKGYVENNIVHRITEVYSGYIIPVPAIAKKPLR